MDTRPPVIVAARARHLPHLAAIERAAARRFAPDDLPAPLRDTATPLADFERAQRQRLLWVAQDGAGVPVAFLLAGVVDGQAHVHEMDVHPGHGRQGLGAALLRRMLAEAAARGFRAVTLTTFAHVPWNAPFYRRWGFEAVDGARCGPELAARLAAEAAAGLHQRVAMRCRLPVAAAMAR